VGQNILPVFTVVNEVSNKYHELLSTLNQDYKFFSGYGLNAVNDTYFKTPNKRNSWRYFGAYVGIHSACLHLQGMLHRAKEMEELIQVQSDETEVADNSTLSRNVTEVLTDIVTEINSCKSCFEVAISELVNEPPTPHSTSETHESLTKSVIEQKQKPVIIGVTDLDPQLEDEVFEAIISHDNLSTGCEDDDDDGYFVSLDAADEVRRRAEKECSDRMLLELKTVLVHKAHEWEKREARALKRASQNAERAGADDIGAVEPSGCDMQSNTGQGSNGEAPERAVAHVSPDEQSNEAKIVASAPEIVKSGSNVVSDSLTSLLIKPTETCLHPRLKRDMLYSSCGSSSSRVPSCNDEMYKSFSDRAEQVETLIAGAATFQPKYLGCDDEETFSGSGENSSSSESENIE
jgi:hypothetical protein